MLSRLVIRSLARPRPHSPSPPPPPRLDLYRARVAMAPKQIIRKLVPEEQAERLQRRVVELQ